MSEGIDNNKSDSSRECIICYYFLMLYFRFQPKLFSACHDMTRSSMSFNDVDVDIVFVRRNDYIFHFWVTSKSKDLDSIENVD